MRKFLAWRRGIPRPVRIVCNIVLAVVLLCLFYVFRGCPDMTAEQAYRRAAARNLVGPGEILGVIPVDDILGYDRLLAAETDEGVILYGYTQANLGFFPSKHVTSEEGNLVYREKGETVTVMAAPSVLIRAYSGKLEIPVILFDQCPKAARAELDLVLSAENYGGGAYSYHLEAQREQGGFFTFWLTTGENGEESKMEVYALDNLCKLYRDMFGNSGSYPAAVRLYDQRDELIYEEELTLRSAAGEAHAQRELENS
ncbi:MAG: hypothetical protein ACI3XJ_01930 [Oscillospiraceae bacterium]